MDGLKSALEPYLKRAGQLEAPPLGQEQSDEDSQHFLADILARQLKVNGRVVILAVALICLLFTVSLLVMVLRSSSAVELSVTGGSFLLQLTMIRLLRQLWLEKSLIDFLMFFSRKVPAKDMVEIVSSLYFGVLLRQENPVAATSKAGTER